MAISGIASTLAFVAIAPFAFACDLLVHMIEAATPLQRPVSLLLSCIACGATLCLCIAAAFSGGIRSSSSSSSPYLVSNSSSHEFDISVHFDGSLSASLYAFFQAFRIIFIASLYLCLQCCVLFSSPLSMVIVCMAIASTAFLWFEQ